mgnify:CR=1 FL=1
MKQELSGIIVPILTPLDAQENVDEARLRRQVDFVIEGGVNGILLFGSNGEFYMTEEDEMAHCLDVVLGQTAGRVPVYFGIGAIRTGKCIRLAKMAQDHGADAISVLQPMFLKPTEDELYLHFRSIAESARNAVMGELRRAFRPEFLNRLDEIILFKPLTKENLNGIIEILMQGLRKRMADKTLKLDVTDAAKSLIIERGFDPIYGARPLKRYLQSAAETLIAKEILRGDLPAGSTLVLDAENGELTCRKK